MARKVELRHTTQYRYDHPVLVGPQSIRLRPMQNARAPILSYALQIDPAPASIHWQQDSRGNTLARITLPAATDHLDVVIELVADLAPQNPFDFLLEPHAVTWPFSYGAEADDLAPCLRPDHPGPLMQDFVAQSPGSSPTPIPTLDLLLGLTHRVRDRTDYITRMEEGVWNPDRTLAEARGSCRDSAWLLVQALRMHGIAARFVSGYLVQLLEDEPDNAELHAWAEAFLPGAGWVGLDATSGLLAAEGHIPLAASPLPIAAAPITGTVEPSAVVLDTGMTVRRLP